MIAWLLLGTAPARADLTAADHRGTIEGERLVWRSSVAGAGEVPVAVRVPVDRVVSVSGAVPRYAEGVLVALGPPYDGYPGTYRAELVVWEPVGGSLSPPLARGPVAQQLSVDDHHLDPAPALGWVRRIGSTGAADVTPHERHVSHDLLGRGHRSRLGDAWVRAPEPVESLDVALRPEGQIALPALIAAVASAVGALGLLAVAHRALDGADRVELESVEGSVRGK